MGLCGEINQKRKGQNNPPNNGQETKPDYSKKLKIEEKEYPSPPSAGKNRNNCDIEINTIYPNLDSISISEDKKKKLNLNNQLNSLNIKKLRVLKIKNHL